MAHNWHDNAPIYRQLKEKVVQMILQAQLAPGDALPSVRQIAADFELNPLTVSRAYQELVDEGIIEMKRGLGMFVLDGAKDRLLQSERERFLQEEWPAVLKKMQSLGIRIDDLIARKDKGGI
ncbi:GntR family transcriptional regulator [Undibacterium luofuense]|uniref:GntR family transcriptional regulator n=1 Tax=Undibacterium luofuense TaxID=2828733 RepID=A0A941DN53_9BURK|nr:GntR family transcriptional regulator [Undibacterium luofuense]MBR7781806.1 GntR family transcriptional regulator [Undibacterium luofuense]